MRRETPDGETIVANRHVSESLRRRNDSFPKFYMLVYPVNIYLWMEAVKYQSNPTKMTDPGPRPLCRYTVEKFYTTFEFVTLRLPVPVISAFQLNRIS